MSDFDFSPSHTEQRFYALDTLRLARRIIATGGREAQTDEVRKALAEILADLDEKIAQFGEHIAELVRVPMRFAYNDRVHTPEGWVGIIKAWEAADRRPDSPFLARVNEEMPPYRMEWFKVSDLRLNSCREA